jgi:hypothetical protein
MFKILVLKFTSVQKVLKIFFYFEIKKIYILYIQLNKI